MDTPSPAVERADSHRLAQNLAQLVDDAETLLKSAEHSGGERVAAARDRIESGLRHVRSELGALEELAEYKVRRAARSADIAAHDHPYVTAGLAAGVGLLVGMLISRR
jgi:ElaB/YqjD/DUF883 family membrane-anchored ribosome-binding protein